VIPVTNVRLTEKEKLVLFGIVRYPDLNDRELAEHLDMNLPTITAIRNRLLRKGLIRPYRVPNIMSFPIELLAFEFSFLQGDRGEKVQPTPRPSADDRLEANRFMTLTGEQSEAAISVHSNYTDFKQRLRTMEKRSNDEGTRRLHREVVLFPLYLSILPNYFNFAPCIKDLFDIPDRYDDPLVLQPRSKERDEGFKQFRSNEESVFRALVKNPASSDSGLAEHLEVTRHTISKLRRRFEEGDLLRKINIPNLPKLGIDLFAITVVRFDSRFSLEDRMVYFNTIQKLLPTFFWVSYDEAALLFSGARDYERIEHVKKQAEALYTRMGFMAESAPINVMTTKNFDVEACLNFSPILDLIF